MEKRSLGKTNLSITVLGYGAMELRDLDQAQSTELLNAMLDQGMCLIDTAPDYGMSETKIGNAIAHRRDEFVLMTKCGCNHDAQGHHLIPNHIWTRAMLLENIEGSLRRLKTDHIDVWEMHSPSVKALAGGKENEVIQTMMEMKQQGKVGAIGLSFANTPKDNPLYPEKDAFFHMREFWDHGLDMMQIIYGGMTRMNEDGITKTAQHGIGTVVRGIVRKYYDNYPDLFKQAGLPELCEPGEGMNEFLVRFAITHPDVDAAIVGTGSLAHLNDNIRAANRGPLSPETYTEAKRRLDAVGVVSKPY